MKRFLLVTTLLLFSVLLYGCGPKDKTFEGFGVEIQLNDTFRKKELLQAQLYLESTSHIFMSNREDKLTLKGYGINSLEDYICAVLDNAGHTSVTFESHETQDYIYAYYESEVDGQEFGYMMIVMEGESHFYTMNFGCFLKNLSKNKSQYMKWAQSITVE